jgi:hypothetical protein
MSVRRLALVRAVVVSGSLLRQVVITQVWEGCSIATLAALHEFTPTLSARYLASTATVIMFAPATYFDASRSI